MTDKNLHDALDGLRFAMVATGDASGPEAGTWKSRPLALAGQTGGTLHFLVGVDSEWVASLEATGSPTTVTFSDPGRNTYVALQGTARTADDRGRIRELWNAGAAAYFDGEDDPKVRVLDVEVHYGEFWDSPSGRLGQLLTLASAAVGKGHDVGDQGAVVPE